MPQMFPMNWFILMILYLASFYIFISLINFSAPILSPEMKMSFPKINLPTWSW